MESSRFLLCLHSHMPYVLSHGKSPHGTDWLFESTAECYLPILDALERLGNEGIAPRWTLSITPILAEQLADPAFASGFEEYCRQKIDYAISDQKEFSSRGDLRMEGTAAYWQRVYARALDAFQHKWGGRLLEAFKHFQDSGAIEIITSAATHGYLPLLGTEESVRAQIAIGKRTYERHFGREPRGIWLPECAYRPAYEWRPPAGQNLPAFPRKGVDEWLAEFGFEYFFVDSHLIRGAEPLGTYQMQFPQLAELFQRSKKFFKPEDRTEYQPYALKSGLTVFARDPKTTVRVWSGDVGYPGDEQYLEFHKHREPGRLKYWRISQEKHDLGSKQPYDPWAAFERIEWHAQDLVGLIEGVLGEHPGGVLTAMYDTELFGHWWWEGPEFLYRTAHGVEASQGLRPASGSDVLASGAPGAVISLPEGSWGEGGYHSVWLNEENHWTWERLYPAERRLRALAGLRHDEQARRVCQQAARELLLAEASDWQFLITTWAARDYAEARFSDHIERFERLAGVAERGQISSEDEVFLADCEAKDAPFQEIDLTDWAPVDESLGHRGVPMS